MVIGELVKKDIKELLDKSGSETIKFFEQETRRNPPWPKIGKDGESVCLLELPKYVDEEIKKSIDTDNVDELCEK